MTPTYVIINGLEAFALNTKLNSKTNRSVNSSTKLKISIMIHQFNVINLPKPKGMIYMLLKKNVRCAMLKYPKANST